MRVVAEGPTDVVFTEENLRQTYGGRVAFLSRAEEVGETEAELKV